MKKVLIINTIGLNFEGITSVIKNYIGSMDRTDLELHFVANSDIPKDLKYYFEQRGFVHCIADRKKAFFRYVSSVLFLLRKGFATAHIHGNSGTMLIEVLLAKLCGVKKVIVHAHSTKTSHPIVNWILKVPMMYLADTCIACSKAAGDWLYGKHPYIVLNNAIDLSKFKFSEAAREKYRAEFGVKEEFLIGHIGHFSPQKNHFFLIDVFYEFHKLEPNSKLLLISDGPRFEQVKAKVSELGLQEAVIFAGRRNDVSGIYSAMDLFILPSNWEGLGMVVVEAQASGLTCVVSDAVPYEAKMTNNVEYISLQKSPTDWAEHILHIPMIRDRAEESTMAASMIYNCGYDIRKEADRLRQIYRS